LAEYTILDKILPLLTDANIVERPELVKFITVFIGKIINLLKADWLFFQYDYLDIFDSLKEALPKELKTYIG
jgi:hypothetical protein